MDTAKEQDEIEEKELIEELAKHPMLVQTLDHWRRYGIKNVSGLRDYLDMQAGINAYKSDNGFKPNWQSVAEARAYLTETENE